MFTSLHIENFKAWKNTGKVRLAPLTVIFGVNSAGKSSLGHLLLALKQTVLSSDRKRPIHLGDENSLIELGTFAECIYNHDLNNSLHFELGWLLPKSLEIKDPLTKREFTGSELLLDVEMSADSNNQARIRHLKYQLMQNREKVLSIKLSRDKKDRLDLVSDDYLLVRNSGRPWPIDEPDKFYRISDQSRARFQNAEFLSDLALQTEAALGRLYYLGPLREYPRRIYSWSGDTPESVGPKGEFVIAALLSANSQQRKIRRGTNSPGSKQKSVIFDAFIADWLKDLGVISNFQVRPLAEGRKEFEVLVKTHPTASEVKITDVGFGVSQVLPALVQAFYCPPNSTVWMEQPEIHLHPQVQSELADVFISAVKAKENGKNRNVQLIIESHSEHFLNRLQRRIAEGLISPDEVAIYFCKRTASSTELEPIKLNLFGDIENWPEHFFGDEMADIAARTKAAMRRKMDARPSP